MKGHDKIFSQKEDTLSYKICKVCTKFPAKTNKSYTSNEKQKS